MRKISFFFLLPIFWGQSSAIFAVPVAVGKSIGTTTPAAIGRVVRPSTTVAIGEPMGSVQRVSSGVLIYNHTETPVSFSVGYETISSTPNKINPREKSYYSAGRAFISGVIDSAGKFFPVKLYMRDGSEIKDSIKYLKNRSGEMAAGAVHYELTKENNQYVLREKQPGLPPIHQASTSNGKSEVPERSTPDLKPKESQPSTQDAKVEERKVPRISIDPGPMIPQK